MTPEEIATLPYRKCVGVMLVNQDGKVFVGQRIDTDAPAWQMPQGGIDPGETPQEAGLRELQEETGIAPHKVRIEAETRTWVRYDLPHDIVPRIWKGRFKGQQQKWFLVRFLGDDADIDIETDHPEFSQWRWLDPSDLPAHIVPFKRAVYETVLTEFAPRI